MAQVLNLPPRHSDTAIRCSPWTDSRRSPLRTLVTTYHREANQSWDSLRQKLNCNGGRFTCLFSDNRKGGWCYSDCSRGLEQARKALESALGGKKKEFENWDKEIKKRTDAGGGGDGGGGGWFRWFGGSGGDHFWQEAQQASLAVLGIILVYLIIAKGEVMLAVIFNPLLFALRGTRNAFTFITSWILQKVAPNAYENFKDVPSQEAFTNNSAKETVVRKWGSN